MRTITIQKGKGGSFKHGWKEATITRAAYGTWEDTKYLDIWFEGMPETLNMRIYSKTNSDGEEFAIGKVFRFANAGITDALDSEGGNTIVKLSDEPSELRGHKLNIFTYKDGDYWRISPVAAPTEFENVAESFSTDDVDYWKGRGEKYYKDYIEPKLNPANQSNGADVLGAPVNTPGVTEAQHVNDNADDIFNS